MTMSAEQPTQQQQDKPLVTKKPEETGSRDPLPLNLMKSLQRKSQHSESGSSNGGNNSDNSALISLGNTSFGFNFDSEESRNSDRNESDDSDGNGPPESTTKSEVAAVISSSENPGSSSSGSSSGAPQHMHRHTEKPTLTSSSSSLTNSSSNEDSGRSSSGIGINSEAHRRAAADAVANLQSIASSFAKTAPSPGSMPTGRELQQKRKAASDDADSGGYNTDDDEAKVKISGSPCNVPSSSASVGGGSVDSDSIDEAQVGGRKKKRKMGEKKREERNAREKERSFRITRQINELRDLLSSGGVIVPKGTKSSVLVEAANYIRMLQQHQYRSEIDRHQLVQQMQVIGSGSHGPQAATAIRHVSAQKGVWSLGNFGGVPPKSAMSFYQPNQVASSAAAAAAPAPEEKEWPQQDAMHPSKVDSHEYRFVFNSCGVGMAIASMGGAFIDCNQLFCQLSEYSKQEICAQTIFNLTSRQDLQQAFDMISQMISPPMDARTPELADPIVLRGAMKTRDDLGLSVSLVKGEDGISKCFCVTLVKNPASPFDTSKPTPVSFESVQQKTDALGVTTTTKESESLNSAPAFTAG